jgi:formylglycine-generating enzyme required for sulfatase activity
MAKSLSDLFKLLRGGPWDHFPKNCRSAYRNHFVPDYASHGVGFCVCCLLVKQ